MYTFGATKEGQNLEVGMPPEGPLTRRPMGVMALSAIGLATLFASFGVSQLLLVTPLSNVFSWDFPLHPGWYEVRTVALRGFEIVLVLVPFIATTLPATAWFESLRRGRRVLLAAWVLWLGLSIPGWVATFRMFAETGGDPGPGLGLFILLFIPPVLLGILVIPLVAWAAARLRKRRIARAAHLTGAST